MADAAAMAIRVRGRVQGVGFRPTVWRFARELGLAGDVLNDAEGVLIRVAGPSCAIAVLLDRLRREPPPLARIDGIETEAIPPLAMQDFAVVESHGGRARTDVAPDAVTCPACLAEVLDRDDRRHGYAFTNCTHCGPRFSIARAIPYDRAATTMAPFALCPDCARDYGDPADRRFHAEPIACPACGPRLRLIRFGGGPAAEIPDPLAETLRLLRAGEIVAIKGLGGFHLACDATRTEAVTALRERKRRDAKPFALMARDLAMVRRHAEVDEAAERALCGAAGPIVLLPKRRASSLPAALAPGLGLLGFMLPTTALHHLILRAMDRPLVMTSGNLSGEPQVTDEDDARTRLGGIAVAALSHDRAIANRIDDSVMRVIGGEPRLLRRGRGHAPASFPLPPGFAGHLHVLAMGGELKAAFCLVQDGRAILSQHMGDLEDARAEADYRRNLALYEGLYGHRPAAIAVDRHPEYLSAKQGRARAAAEGLRLVEVQHHHAHVAACLGENRRPLGAAPVLGIIADGLGFGGDGTFWGGEFLLADYRDFRRLARLKPVAMPGGSMAAREPWRNLYAQLAAAPGWSACLAEFGRLPLCAALSARPLPTLDTMIRQGRFAPLASSCGRLFDAVAAALGLCPDRQDHEGQAAMRLEALADPAAAGEYPFAVIAGNPSVLDPGPLWRALLGDLQDGVPAAVIAMRFHRGLALAMVRMALHLRGEADRPRFDTVALSGGCFQNALLFETLATGLERAGFTVLSHREVPANDGGLALGQALVALAATAGAGPCA